MHSSLSVFVPKAGMSDCSLCVGDKFDGKPDAKSAAEITVAVKDCIDVEGWVTGMGSAVFADAAPARETADLVIGLDHAGYTLLGKLVMHELAFGMTGVNAFYGTPVNPNFPDLIPGGSSSGAAVAVAGGEVDVAIGTDTGGSIRLPAACCGVFGFKPTFGRVSRKGVHPQVSTLDSVGPMAANLSHIEMAMTAIDDSFEIERFDGVMKLGWLTTDRSQPISERMKEIEQSVLGCDQIELVSRDLPSMQKAHNAGMTLIAKEALESYRHLDQSKMGSDVAARLVAAEKITEEDVLLAKEIQRLFRQEVSDALDDLDALLLPTLPHLPMRLNDALDGMVDMELSSLVRPFNLSGHPALSLPLVCSDPAPVSLQIVGHLDDDSHVCAVAKRLEELGITG